MLSFVTATAKPNHDMLRFSRTYFLLTLLLFAVECGIALFVHDRIIRPFIGDALVVMLIYCFVQTFGRFPKVPTALWVLAFSFAIEAGQYFKLVEILGLQASKLARVVIGTSFSWWDILAYIGGIGVVLFVENKLGNAKPEPVPSTANATLPPR